MTHSRAASINSRDFVVALPSEDDSDHSTDSYQDSVDEDDELVNTFDSVKYLVSSLENALSSVEFNRSVALQAQSSGNLKSKEIELLQLQNEAQDQLKEYKERFKKGLKLLHQVSKDLKAAQHKVNLLETHVSSKYPIEFAQSKEKIESRTSELQEIIRQNNNSDGDDDNDVYY